MQTSGPCRPRHRLAIVKIHLHVAKQKTSDGQHRMLDQCASYSRLSALLRPSSSTQLRSDEQTAVGIFSLLNDYRIRVGLGPFGWINPWLYGVGSFGFNDIISGHNPGCGTQGFEATDGWDPVRPARSSSLRFRPSLIPSSVGHRPRVAGCQTANKYTSSDLTASSASAQESVSP